MPVVPTYDDLKVTPNGTSDQRATNAFSAADAAIPGEQAEKFGGAVQKFGGDVGDIALDLAGQANQLKVNDALNSARQASLDLTFNPQTGYKSLKGKDALNTQDADGNPIALPDLYTSKLKNTVDGIGSTLTNPDQQNMFAKASGDLLTSFHGDAEAHMLGEYKNYHMSVNNGAIDLATQGAAATGITNPAQTQQYVDTIKAANASNQQYTGASGNEVMADTQKQVSAIHSQAIQSGIENNDITGAAKWFNSNRSQMTGEDILKSQGQINTKLDAYNALKAVGATTQSMSSRLQPSSMDQLTNLMFNQESGNKQFGGAGSVAGPNAPTTSSSGAIGVAQVEPGTGPEAAKAAGLPWDPDKFANDAVYNAALGKAYFQKQLQSFGDVSKALAAYNAGPQATKDAIAAANAAKDPDWLKFLPQETQDYVSKISKQYDAGAGVPKIPSEQDFVNDAVTRLGDNPRTEAIAATRESAEKQYALAIKDRTQTAEQAQSRIQAELNANGGSMTNLSPQSQDDMKTVNRLDPQKGLELLRYATATRSTDKTTTNMEAYNQAMTYPEELAKMSDTQFQNFVMTNFSKEDQEKVITKRADILNGSTNNSAGSINDKAVHVSLSSRLDSIGIPTTGKLTTTQKIKAGAILHFVNDSIYDQQTQLGRKMSPKEIDDHVSDLFNKSVTLPGLLYGSKDANLMSTDIGSIPVQDKQMIVDNFAKHGITNPQPQDILEKWWKDKTNVGK